MQAQIHSTWDHLYQVMCVCREKKGQGKVFGRNICSVDFLSKDQEEHEMILKDDPG